MKSAVETLSPTRAKLTVEVPFEELKPSLDAAYKKIAQQINVPGFRRGKVPPTVIDRQVGRGAVLDQAINDVLPQKYVEALQENSLEPVAQPEIEVTRLEDNETLEFTAEVDVKPEITLPAYDDLEAQVDDIELTDEDVEEQVQALRERFATLIDVDRAAADGDFVVMDLKATQDGEVVEGAEVTGMSYQVGRGGMLDGLDEALVGMSAGDEKTFTSQLVGGDLRRPGRRGRGRRLPGPGAGAARARRRVRAAGQRVRHRRGARRPTCASGSAAASASSRPPPRVTPSSRCCSSGRDPAARPAGHRGADRAPPGIEQQLAYAGITMEKYLEDEGQTVEEFEADLERRVRDAVTAQFLLDEIAKKEELGVDQNELSEHLVRRAQQSGQDPQEFANHMFEHNHVPELVQEILRGKALAAIVESATVTDASGNPVELKNLRPDGTIGEPRRAAEDAAEESRRPSRPDTRRSRSVNNRSLTCYVAAHDPRAARRPRRAVAAVPGRRRAGGPDRARHPRRLGRPGPRPAARVRPGRAERGGDGPPRHRRRGVRRPRCRPACDLARPRRRRRPWVRAAAGGRRPRPVRQLRRQRPDR